MSFTIIFLLTETDSTFYISDNIDTMMNVEVEEFVSKKATNKLVQQTKVYFFIHPF